MTKIYKDGLLMSEAETGKTQPLPKGGALMLGAEQDCYGGCTDRGQGFYGYMDEVKIWKTARSQQDILHYMRSSTGLENHPDLAAYWQFNDPEENGLVRESSVARDVSGRGNDIRLITLPVHGKKDTLVHGSGDVGVVTFRDNYIMNRGFEGMPQEDITIDFWARTPEYSPEKGDTAHHSEFLSFSSFAHHEKAGPHQAKWQHLTDAILIEKYQTEYSGTADLNYNIFSTRGAVSVHVNANRQGNGKANDHWIDFDAQWTDGEWHHVGVTWHKSSGEVKLYIDGKNKVPFWRSYGGQVSFKRPEEGGVDPHIAAGTQRGGSGSLVIGNQQFCHGGCFSPQYSLHGDMANLRIWNKVLGQQDIEKSSKSGTAPPAALSSALAIAYSFDSEFIKEHPGDGRTMVVPQHSTKPGTNDLYFGGDAPLWVYSTAPLTLSDGRPSPPPIPGGAGHALSLSDQQVLILKDFKEFPSNQITVEFWMLSTDACRQGTPISYATGDSYGVDDNTFLIANYNDWVVGVAEDEGTLGDHTSGISCTDGKWHHVAVTWRSSDGQTVLYVDGEKGWEVERARGKNLGSGGTLVIGREQDCQGGCFDSAPGAAGKTQSISEQEYGSQDFFGLIDEIRIWKVVRSQEEIQQGMHAALYQRGVSPTGGHMHSDDGDTITKPIDPHHPDLVAYWTFDDVDTPYSVADMTGKGHDLAITKTPKWEVVRALAVCGNGILEGLEECDDGDVTSGNGCSAQCTVEQGWECTRTSPSVCWKKSSDQGPGGGKTGGGGGGGGGKQHPPHPPHPAPGPSSSSSSSSHKSRWMTWVGWIFSLTVVGLVAGGVVLGRERITTEVVPMAEEVVFTVKEAIAGVVHKVAGIVIKGGGVGGRGRGFYDLTGDLDAEDMEDAPEFTTMSMPTRSDGYSRLPGGVGPSGGGGQ